MQRLVSLAPHLTELLFAAGAGDQVVGVVEYSDYPPAAQNLPRVGGASQLNAERIVALQPDLVLAWKSGNRSSDLEMLQRLGIRVLVTEVPRLDGIAQQIREMGHLAGTPGEAERSAQAFEQQLQRLHARYAQRPPVSVFYQIWTHPPMTINGRHVISQVLRLCGGQNIFAKLGPLAPTVSEESVVIADPEVIISAMANERAQALQTLQPWRRFEQLQAVRAENLFWVPADLIQRPSPRILEGAKWVCEALEEARQRRSLRLQESS